MLAFILIVGVLIAIYFIVNSQKRKKEEEQRRLENAVSYTHLTLPTT